MPGAEAMKDGNMWGFVVGVGVCGGGGGGGWVGGWGLGVGGGDLKNVRGVGKVV